MPEPRSYRRCALDARTHKRQRPEAALSTLKKIRDGGTVAAVMSTRSLTNFPEERIRPLFSNVYYGKSSTVKIEQRRWNYPAARVQPH